MSPSEQLTYLIVPGFASTQEPGTLQPLVDELTRRGHQVIYMAPDRSKLTSYGASSRWQQVVGAPAKHINGLAAGLAGKVVLVGHSYGAILAVVAASRQPGFYAGIIAIAPANAYKHDFSPLALRFLAKSWTDIFAAIYHRNNLVQRLSLRLVLTAYRYSKGAVRRTWQEVLAMVNSNTTSWLLAGMDMPRLVISCKKDRLFPDKLIKRGLAAAGYTGEVVTINTGHDAHFHPATLADAIESLKV